VRKFLTKVFTHFEFSKLSESLLDAKARIDTGGKGKGLRISGSGKKLSPYRSTHLIANAYAIMEKSGANTTSVV
jgi:hypothetical protein